MFFKTAKLGKQRFVIYSRRIVTKPRQIQALRTKYTQKPTSLTQKTPYHERMNT